MTQDLAAAAARLADLLARENQDLAALDLTAAVTHLEAKSRVTAEFATLNAQAAAANLSAAERQRLAEQIGSRLRQLTVDNKRLLERALMVQRRVIGTLAQAAPAAVAHAPRYNSRGAVANAALPAVALSTRA